MITDFIDFEDWLYSRGMAKSTIRGTMSKMRFFEKRMELESREAIMGFLRLERRNGSTKQKINGYIKYLNRWLESRGEDKIEYLPELKARSFRKKAFDADQVKQIVSRTIGPTIEDRRNHAMVLLALNTGLRRGEIARLKVADIHRYYLTVVDGKGEKDRDVYIDEETRSIISEYLKVRNHQECPHVFTTKNGPISEYYMGKLAADIKQKTGINEFAWHKCRHTYAKNMLRNDVDLETLRQMLGHEDLQTTGIYAELDTGEALERVMKKNVKFYREGEGFKSSKPWYISDGPMGI